VDRESSEDEPVGKKMTPNMTAESAIDIRILALLEIPSNIFLFHTG
jgi:hypothetical protein